MGRRSPSPSPSRSPSWCHTPALKRGPWTPDEDRKLLAYIQQHGRGSWRCLPLKAGLQRCGKSCRLRWTNYLRPDIKRGKFSLQEEQTIIQLHALVGNKWSAIATHLPNRTDNEIKNYWNTHLKKRLAKMGIDPVTHKPTTSTNLSHMAQWENARLEAEARLRQTSTHHHQLPLGPKSNIATHAPHIVSPTSTLSFLRSVSTISGVVEMESSHIAPLLVTFQFPTEIQGFGFGTQQCDMDHPIYSS